MGGTLLIALAAMIIYSIFEKVNRKGKGGGIKRIEFYDE
jgi:hypothetical protein